MYHVLGPLIFGNFHRNPHVPSLVRAARELLRRLQSRWTSQETGAPLSVSQLLVED